MENLCIPKDFGMILPTRRLCFATLVLALTVPATGKMYEAPRSSALKETSPPQVDRRVLPAIDAKRLLAEDMGFGKNAERPGPRRFAVAARTAYTLTNSGTVQILPDGRLWRLRIHTPGATNMNLGISRFEMPQGAKLWIYDPARKRVDGPYTSQHRSRLGSLWTPVVEGNEIVVEVFQPTGIPQPDLLITHVNQGYRGFNKDSLGFGSAGTCNIDVVCPEGVPWQNEIRATAVYTIDGTGACTGTMMNNTAIDFTPYFLSANHCGVNSGNDGTVVVYWNFQSPTCGAHGPGSLDDNQTGSTFRASHAPSDFLLLQLDDKPNDLGFNVYYAGWDANGTAPAAVVGIHHPSADVKAISFSNSAPVSASYLSNVPNASANHWRVVWDSGVTEPGSSGSCIFDTNRRCIGQLHGGYSYCSTPTEPDWYGKFSVSWTGGGSSGTRLRDWLDPGNTGTLSLHGDPHITMADGTRYDLQGAGEFVSLRDADGLEIQTRQSPITTSFTPGPDPYDGLATCVSLNTAVAARVGKSRVTYQPGDQTAGTAAPGNLLLRVDGVLRTLGNIPLNLPGGGRLARTAAPGGLQIDFPDKTTMLVTPGWWSSQSKWYLNVDIVRNRTAGGLSGAQPGTGPGAWPRGIAAARAPGSWLPALPNGSSVGPMPALLNDRYAVLYGKFANSWRVTNTSSLFDYAPGTSTANFTLSSWPGYPPRCVAPNSPPTQPLPREIAESACAEIKNGETRKSCVFDVMITGERGFGNTYLVTERIREGLATAQFK